MTDHSTAPPGAAMRRVTADSVVGSVGTMVSRASGLVRVVVVAAVLGPTQFGNLYQATNNLPNLTFELLTGALFLSLVVPALVRHVDLGDTAAAARLASGFLTLSVGAALGIVALAVAAGPVILRILTAGVPEEVARTGLGASWLLLGLLLLQVPLYLVAGMGTAVQNARGRYAMAAAAPSLENIGIIVVMVCYALIFGVQSPGSQGLGAVALLAGGTTGAVLLHATAQWLGARSCGVTLRPVTAWRDTEVRGLLRLAVPSLAYAALNVSRYFCILVVAGAVPGGVVAFTLAIAFYNLPVALGTRPVAQAAMPDMSRAYDREDAAGFSEAFSRSFGLALFLTVPAAVAYALLSGPVAGAVAFGEMATAEGRELVRLCLLGLSMGVIGEAAVIFETQAAYARRDARRPLMAVAVRTGLAVAGMLGSLAVLDGPALLLAIGLSVASSDVVAAVILYWAVLHPLPRPETSLRRTILRIGAGSLAMAPPVLLLLVVAGPQSSQLENIALVLGAGTVGAAVYLAVLRAMHSPELKGLLSLGRPSRPTGDSDENG